ncbi:hypothetical protein [Aliiroseovarius sp.]|uniref:hypothetical protein n=1 Tax=Aliiroseovarius sp. TaxID=1872442 RepID=UPI003BAD8CAA
MSDALPILPRDMRPWLWPATVTVGFAALMTFYVVWCFETSVGHSVLLADRLPAPHLLMLALPVLAHLALAWHWRRARRLNLALALLGLITWQQATYPAGIGLPAMLNLIPEWQDITLAATPPEPLFVDPLPITRAALTPDR